MKVLQYKRNWIPMICEMGDSINEKKTQRMMIEKLSEFRKLIAIYRDEVQDRKNISAVFYLEEQGRRKRNILYGDFIVCECEGKRICDISEDGIRIARKKIIQVISKI